MIMVAKQWPMFNLIHNYDWQ